MPQMLCLWKTVQPSNPHVKEESLKNNDLTIQLKNLRGKKKQTPSQLNPRM